MGNKVKCVIHISVYESGGVEIEFDGEHFGKKELLRAQKLMRIEYRNKVKLHRKSQNLDRAALANSEPAVKPKVETMIVNGKEVKLKGNA